MERFNASYQLPASVRRTIELITTQAYYEEKYAEMQTVNVEIEVLEDSAEFFKVSVARDIPIGDSVPGFVRKLLGDTTRLQQEISWRKTNEPVQHGEFKGRLMGKDGGVFADLVLQPDGEHCSMRIEGQINVSVPLVGRKIEKLMAEKSSEAFAYDLQVTADYVAKHA